MDDLTYFTKALIHARPWRQETLDHHWAWSRLCPLLGETNDDT